MTDFEPEPGGVGTRCPFCMLERQRESSLLTLREMSAHIVMVHGEEFHELVAQVSREWDEQVGSAMARQSKAEKARIEAEATRAERERIEELRAAAFELLDFLPRYVPGAMVAGPFVLAADRLRLALAILRDEP